MTAIASRDIEIEVDMIISMFYKSIRMLLQRLHSDIAIYRLPTA